MAEMKVQQYKKDAVASLKKGFEGTRHFLFADYRGLTVAQVTELRSVLRGLGAQIHVVKNAYAKIAFRQIEHGQVESYFVGPTAIAYIDDEAGPVAKEIFRLAKDMPLELKGALLDGEVYDARALEVFSRLPTRTELVRQLMGSMKAPAHKLACVLAAIAPKLVRTLAAVRDAKIEKD